MKKTLTLLLAFVLVLSLAACGGGSTPTQAPATNAPDNSGTATEAPAAPASDLVVKVGSKDFSEQLILGQLTIKALEANGIQTKDVTNVAGSDTCRKALETGEFDIYWEYTGTAWGMLLQNEDMLSDPQELFDLVKATDEENGIIWLQYAPLNNTYALVIPEDTAAELGIETYSELGQYLTENPGSLILTCDHEFTARPDGLPGLVETYGTDFGDGINIMDMGLVYQALQGGQADVAMVFATDGRIKQYGLRLLKDDKNFFPIYNAAPTVRADVLEQLPQIEEILAPIAELLTDEVMQDLNLMVDSGDYEPDEVAENFLRDNGFIS